MMRVTDRQGSHAGRHARLTVVACVLLAGCQKANPPLVPPDRVAALETAKGPNAGRIAANTADDLVILNGEALRRRARADLLAVIASYWPARRQGQAARAAFPDYHDPDVDCTVDTKDGTVCTLTLTPAGIATSSPELQMALADVPVIKAPPGLAEREVAAEAAVDAATDAAGRHGVVFVRYGIDDGATPNVRALPDPRPLPETATANVTVVTGIDGKLTADPFGTLPADCRTETATGAASQRRICTMEYGPYLISVSREAWTSSPPLTDLSADPELVRDMRDAAKLLASALLRSPPLQHPLPPPRLANDPAAMMATMTMGMPDQSGDLRALIAKNAPRTPWHDVAGQADFDTLCRAAAAARQPLLIMTVSPSQVAGDLLYTDDMAPFADHAMLAVVQMSPDGQPNAWAHAFAKAIGAGDFGALTATDRPRVHGDRCEVGRVYQSPWDKASPRAAIEALLTGHPPKPAPRQPD